VSLSRLETTAATKFYYFVVINVFFGSILTGSAFSELQLFVGQSSLVG
jgi:lysine-specific demethylase 3